jgi:Zn-finger nucleic acid-binding protein
VTAAPQNCPRCSEPLAHVELKGVGVQSCQKCKGTLLAPPRLTALMEAMSDELLKSFDPDDKLDALPDRGAGLSCPRCQRAMTSDDYCGAHLVTFDRCERCELLWIDADELGTMTLMWARMEARHTKRQAATAEMMSAMDSLIRSQRMKRVVENTLMRGGGFIIGL